MKLIFGIISFLIVYGSLYPFNFSLENYSNEGLKALFNFNLFNSYASDLLANIVLFIPFGILICAAFPKNLNIKKYALLLSISALFAFLIQVLQLWTVGRIPWGGDAIWNTAGCAIGFAVFYFINLGAFQQLKTLENYKQISLALAIAIILIKLAPFAPSLDFQVLKDNIKMVLRDPSIDLYRSFEYCVFWLSGFYLLKVVNPHWARVSALALIVAFVLCAKFFIVSSSVSLSQLLAGVLALGLWSILHFKINAMQLGLLMLVCIVGSGLHPFELRDSAADFSWLPFRGSISGNIIVNIIALLEKLVIYGSAIWLLYLATKRLSFAAAVCLAIAFISEYSQRFFIDSVPDITDSVLVIFVAMVISILLSHLSVEAKNESDTPVSPEQAEAASGNLITGATNERAIRAQTSQNNFTLFDSRPVHHNLNYISGLDGLRAIAALAVFFVHFQQFTDIKGSLWFFDLERWLANGKVGVALFFVLSGFLLSTPFWKKLAIGEKVSLKHYFTNRILRIVPIYYACMFGIIALKGFEGRDIYFENIVSHLFFMHNLQDDQVMTLNPPFWTLAVEFQFYLLLPLLFVVFNQLFRALGKRATQLFGAILIVVIYIAYRLFRQSLESYDDWPISFPLIWPTGVHVESATGMALTYSLFAHLPHFLLGVMAASLLGLKSRISNEMAEMLFWSASAIVLLILATPVGDIFQVAYGRYHFPLVPMLLALIVFTAPLTQDARALLELRPIKWMGVISYGIYIFHFPIQNSLSRVFSKADIDINEHALIFFIVSLAITLFISHFSFVLIERPLLKRFRSTSNDNQTERQKQLL